MHSNTTYSLVDLILSQSIWESLRRLAKESDAIVWSMAHRTVETDLRSFPL